MSFPQSGHRMSSLSVRKPRPTSEREHFLQLKQSLCHCRSSKEMYFVPPSPVNREERTPGGEREREHCWLEPGPQERQRSSGLSHFKAGLCSLESVSF